VPLLTTGAGGFPPVAAGGGSVAVDAVDGSVHYIASGVGYTGLTVGAGSHRALILTLNFDGAEPTGVSVTWNGTAMTQIVAGGSGGNRDSQLWGLINPASGANTFAISWTGGGKVFAAAISFTGVDQTGGATSFPNSTSGTGVATLSVTSAVGNKVVACECSGGGQGTSTGTQIYDDHVSGSIINAMAQYDAGAATPVVIGNSGTNSLIVATDVKAG
jgi:hypothetical protein